MTDLCWMTAAEAARAIAARELSPVELTTVLLDRIARLDPTLHAFIRLDAEAAMAAARAAEAEIIAGRSRGPLHGVPVGIKDIIDVAGLPTTCHSKILIDHVAAADAVCVAKLRSAGAIVLGKLSTHEFAIGGPSFNQPDPITPETIARPWRGREGQPPDTDRQTMKPLAYSLIRFSTRGRRTAILFAGNSHRSKLSAIRAAGNSTYRSTIPTSASLAYRRSSRPFTPVRFPLLSQSPGWIRVSGQRQENMFHAANSQDNGFLLRPITRRTEPSWEALPLVAPARSRYARDQFHRSGGVA